MDRYLIGSVALLLIGAVAAVFFYIPILSLIAAMVTVLALVLMFGLGLYFGLSVNRA